MQKILYSLFSLFILTLLAFGDYMGLIPINILGIKFYGADFLIILLGFGLIIFGGKYFANSIIAFFLFFFISFGIISLIYGFLQGYELRDVFGDYRRIFFYSITFTLAWNILNSPSKVIFIQKYLYYAVIPVIILSFLRAWKGVSWHPNYSEGDLRAVSYASVSILFVAFYDSLIRIITGGSQAEKRKYYFWIFAIFITLVISNYRLLWMIPIVGLFVILWILARRGYLRKKKTILSIFLVILIGIIAILILLVFLNDIYSLIEQKFVNDVLGFRFTNSFRYFVWGQAWKEFTSNELFGVGIGHKLEYDILNTQGDWYTRTSTTHNIFLDILYQTGLIGLILFAIPQIIFIFYVWVNLPKIQISWMVSATAFFLAYLSMLLVGMFQPFLTVPSVAVLFYAFMAITVRFVFWGRRAQNDKDLILEYRDI